MSDAPTYVVEIPGLKTVSEMNVREHWAIRNKRRAHQARLVRSALLVAGVRKGVPRRVHLTRVGRRPMDSDNACISFKAIRDSVAEVLGFNDSHDVWTYAQEAGPYGVRIEVWT